MPTCAQSRFERVLNAISCFCRDGARSQGAPRRGMPLRACVTEREVPRRHGKKERWNIESALLAFRQLTFPRLARKFVSLSEGFRNQWTRTFTYPDVWQHSSLPLQRSSSWNKPPVHSVLATRTAAPVEPAAAGSASTQPRRRPRPLARRTRTAEATPFVRHGRVWQLVLQHRRLRRPLLHQSRTALSRPLAPTRLWPTRLAPWLRHLRRPSQQWSPRVDPISRW